MATPALGTQEYSQQLLNQAKNLGVTGAGVNALTASVNANVPSTLPTGVPTGVGQTDQPALPQGVDFKMPKKDTVPSSALVGGKTPTEIMNRRSELEQQFLAASKPTDTELGLSEQLNSVKQLSRRAQLDLNRETERIETESGRTRDISQQWTSDLARRMQRTIGDLGVGASGLADALNAEVSRRTVSTDGITKLMQFDKENIGILQDLQKMTMPEMIGSPQVNEMTGEVTAFQRDPQTGAITSSVIGNVGSTKKYIQSGTYKDPATGAETFWGLGADGMIETQVMSGSDPEITRATPTVMIQQRDENGNVVTDQDGNPIMVDAASDPFVQMLLGTRGGKNLTDTPLNQLNKGLAVLDQLGVLQNNIKGTKTGPVLGAFRGANPWDTNAQVIKAQLNAIIPNLARGVFGEVGVLTDNDIALYSKTIGNLKSTNDVNNAIMYITLDMIGKSISRTLEVQAAGGRDVSGFVDIYTSMQDTKNSILSSLPGSVKTSGGAQTYQVGNTTYVQGADGLFYPQGSAPAAQTTPSESIAPAPQAAQPSTQQSGFKSLGDMFSGFKPFSLGGFFK